MKPYANPKPRLRAMVAHLEKLDAIRKRADEAVRLGVYVTEEQMLDAHRLAEELEAKAVRKAVAMLCDLRPSCMEGITVVEDGFIDRADMAEQYEMLAAIFQAERVRPS